MLGALEDEQSFSPAKQFMAAALDARVDPSDPRGLERFVDDWNYARCVCLSSHPRRAAKTTSPTTRRTRSPGAACGFHPAAAGTDARGLFEAARSLAAA